MNKTLQMLFTNEEGRTVTVSLLDPRDDLTGVEVASAMDLIVQKNVFASTGGALLMANGARVVSRDIEVIL